MSPDRVLIARHGRHELTTLMLSSAQVEELVERMLKSSGRRIDINRPFIDAMLPEGHRLHVVLRAVPSPVESWAGRCAVAPAGSQLIGVAWRGWPGRPTPAACMVDATP